MQLFFDSSIVDKESIIYWNINNSNKNKIKNLSKYECIKIDATLSNQHHYEIYYGSIPEIKLNCLKLTKDCNLDNMSYVKHTNNYEQFLNKQEFKIIFESEYYIEHNSSNLITYMELKKKDDSTIEKDRTSYKISNINKADNDNYNIHIVTNDIDKDVKVSKLILHKNNFQTILSKYDDNDNSYIPALIHIYQLIYDFCNALKKEDNHELVITLYDMHQFKMIERICRCFDIRISKHLIKDLNDIIIDFTNFKIPVTNINIDDINEIYCVKIGNKIYDFGIIEKDIYYIMYDDNKCYIKGDIFVRLMHDNFININVDKIYSGLSTLNELTFNKDTVNLNKQFYHILSYNELQENVYEISTELIIPENSIIATNKYNEGLLLSINKNKECIIQLPYKEKVYRYINQIKEFENITLSQAKSYINKRIRYKCHYTVQYHDYQTNNYNVKDNESGQIITLKPEEILYVLCSSVK